MPKKIAVGETVETDILPARKARRAKANVEEAEVVNDISGIYGDILDDVWKRQGMDDGLASDMEPMSTGMLALDMILGGGIRPAWYTNFGGEQSAKTTTTLTILAAAIKAAIPYSRLEDFEGSTRNSIPYVQNIFRSAGIKKSVQEVFGVKDPDTGKWLIRPIVGYIPETRGEAFFDRLHDLLKTLPDKKKIGKDWWLIFEDTKANKAKFGDRSNPTMAKKHGAGIYVKANDGALQALIITDSYPGMNPEANDEDESNNSLALQARMFAKHIPRVKGRLASKMVAVIGVNQLRSNPMARHGPPESEPGGQALKFFSDVRIRHTSRAISGVPTKPAPKENPDDKSTEVEPSVQFDGQDTYRYIAVKADKNKLWTPKRQAWIRIWVEDANGEAQGLDPVYDTYWYLYFTGQAKGSKRNAITFNLEGYGLGTKTISWMEFKKWVLGTKEEKAEICAKLGYKPIDIRKFCFHQMQEGVGERLYVAYKNSKGKDDEDEGQED